MLLDKQADMTTFDSGKASGRAEFAWTTRRVKVIVFLSCAGFIQGCCYALMAPFYPKEATDRGVSASMIGITLGIYCFLGIFGSPLVGEILARNFISARLCLFIGLLVDGIGLTLIGFSKNIEDGSTFFWFCTGLRFVESIGFALSMTCYYAIVGTEFRERAEVFIPAIETFFGIGMMSGPLIGGGLYQLGGYSIPFYVFGIGGIVLSGMLWFMLPIIDSPETFSKGIKDIIDWTTVVNMLIALLCFISMSFNEISLSLRLLELGYSPGTIGACYIVVAGFYSLFSFIWGSVTALCSDARYVALLGAVFVISGLFEYNKNIWIILFTQALLGIGFGSMFVSGFVHTLSYVISKKGFDDSFSTFALISGVFSSILSLGCVGGPVVGGILEDGLGYFWGSITIASIDFVAYFILILTILAGFMKRSRCDELTALL